MIVYDNLDPDNKKIVEQIIKKHDLQSEEQSAYVQIYRKYIKVDGNLYTKELACLLEISESLKQ